MEKDREETNLGPEVAEETQSISTATAIKQPRRRFVGRRNVEEQEATQGAAAETTQTHGTALQTRKPTRGPRVLNQVPLSILDDADINAAIAHLPSNYNFEIHKTIHRIRTAAAKNVALQFPEGLLMFAPLISDILTQFCPGTETLIMGDVTYGACCIDDYTARALGCDLLVHYGHSCLVPVDTTKGIKVLYVFVTIGIDTEHLVATIERNFQPGKRLALVGTIQFNATLHSILPRLRSTGYDPFLPRSAPLSAGEILGCTAPSLVSKSHTSSSSSTAQDNPLGADLILYVGDGRFHLEAILISSPSLRSYTYRYDPYTRRLTHETYSHEEMHALRHHAISTARRALQRASARETPAETTGASTEKLTDGYSSSAPQQQQQEDEADSTQEAAAAAPGDESLPVETTSEEPRTWAVILGTLGRQGNPHTLSLITAHLQARGVPVVTLLLSEVQPQKLALMSADVAVWVQIACPRLSIDWGYAFERPLLSPYEALVALGVRDTAAGTGAATATATSWYSDVVKKTNGPRRAGPDDVRSNSSPQQHETPSVSIEELDDDRVGLYPMDFYAKDGLGRTRADQVPSQSSSSSMEVEVR